MNQTPARAHHRPAPSDLPSGFEYEEERQQLIGWRLLVCVAAGAALWLGVIEILAAVVPGPGLALRILAAARLVVLIGGWISLCLAALAGLNGLLKRGGPGKGGGSRSGSPTSRRVSMRPGAGAPPSRT